MITTAPLIAFAIGILAILVSANIFLFLSSHLAYRFKISPLIISIIVVALITSLPELAVTAVALYQGDTGLALGNALGSYVMNIVLVLGLATVLGKVKIGSYKSQRNALILFAVTSIFVLLQFSSIPAYQAGWFLIFMLLITFGIQIFMGINGRNKEDAKYMNKIAKQQKNKKPTPNWIVFSLAVTSVAGLLIGANISVTAVANLSAIWGLSTTFLGMTLTAISTSLPELVTVILAQRKKENKVVIGTLVGSNIINVTLFPGLVALIAGTMYSSAKSLVFVELIAVITLIIIFWFKGRVVSKWVGICLLVLFAMFTLLFYSVS